MGLMALRLAGYPTPEIWALAEQAGARYAVDPALVMAVIQVESSYNPRAVNPSDPSYGLMQMLPSTATLVAGRPVSGQELLDDPGLAVDLGTQYLAMGIARYGNTGAGIAAYNAGVARKNAQGQYVNSQGATTVQAYVDKVLDAYIDLSGGLRPLAGPLAYDVGPLPVRAAAGMPEWLSSPWTWALGGAAVLALILITD